MFSSAKQAAPQPAAGNDGSWELPPGAAAAHDDDALLGCLVLLTRHFERPMSADALTAGLPVKDGRLTPDLFPRAAMRAGLNARLVRRSLAGIPNLVLPAVLLLEDRRACILLRREDDGSVSIIDPLAGDGVITVPLADLDAAYTGPALFVRAG